MSLHQLNPTLVPFLVPFLPNTQQGKPYVTLTYAQSLDARISAMPGVQTKISHSETKTMTHFLRSRHDGILVGVGTVLADDPKLNCRFNAEESSTFTTPRPIVIDPHSKWHYSKSQLRNICDKKQGLAPFIMVDSRSKPREEDIETLKQQKGAFIYLTLDTENRDNNWQTIFSVLFERKVHSVMVEGGAEVIKSLLVNPSLVDALIITIGPVYLGREGTEVSPPKGVRLHNVHWWQGIQDAILCGRLSKD